MSSRKLLKERLEMKRHAIDWVCLSAEGGPLSSRALANKMPPLVSAERVHLQIIPHAPTSAHLPKGQKKSWPKSFDRISNLFSADNMAGASDKARFYLEQSVPELKEYERKGIFTTVRCGISPALSSTTDKVQA